MKPSRWIRSVANFFRDIQIIEVLVVIAIIAILAAMLIPALARAKQRDEQRKKSQTVTTIEKQQTFEVGDTITVSGLDRKGIVNYISETGFVDVLVEGSNGGAPNLLKGVNPKLIRK